jgi:hypothetical protein
MAGRRMKDMGKYFTATVREVHDPRPGAGLDACK